MGETQRVEEKMPLFILDRCCWACNMSCTITPTFHQPQPVLQDVGEGWEPLQRPSPHPSASG